MCYQVGDGGVTEGEMDKTKQKEGSSKLLLLTLYLGICRAWLVP